MTRLPPQIVFPVRLQRILPSYWVFETSGTLRPAIEAYLLGGPMSAEHIATMRDYLRQWIMADVWRDVDDLRDLVDHITSRTMIAGWLVLALDAGIDPL